jgi:hypothetical protein
MLSIDILAFIILSVWIPKQIPMNAIVKINNKEIEEYLIIFVLIV